jgi:hypothetical protein
MTHRSLMVILVCGAHGLSGVGARAQDAAPADGVRGAAPPHALSTTDPEEYEKLVRALGDPHLQVREVATERLCLLDMSYLPQLSRSFQQEGDFEVKRRLRYVVEYIFHREQIAGRDGFLGVEIEMNALRVGLDPVTRKEDLGIGVKRAMEGFAARRAGMENGDVIIRFNGQPIPDERSSTAFVNLVSSHSPGERLELTVLRLQKPRAIVARVGERPMALLDGAVLEFFSLNAVGDPSPGRGGLRVLHVEPGTPASTIGLPPRSCVLAVNDRSLDTAGAENILRTALQEAPQNSELTFTVAEAGEVPLQITLGTRPVTMIRDQDVLQEARSRFVAFWKEQGGEFLQLRHRRMQSLNIERFRSSDQLMPEIRILP